MPYQRMADSIAAQWVAVDQRRRAASVGSSEAADCARELAQLCAEYLRLIDDAARNWPSWPAVPGRTLRRPTSTVIKGPSRPLARRSLDETGGRSGDE
jgi:hypothetical protein